MKLLGALRKLKLHLTSSAAALPFESPGRFCVHGTCTGPCHAQSGSAVLAGSQAGGSVAQGHYAVSQRPAFCQGVRHLVAQAQQSPADARLRSKYLLVTSLLRLRFVDPVK